ncbi:hypothetical protein G6F32_015879 [Rhizopus arrhizus]|nr:hypothetical protein G6F32_015879 [Rhizopus arrhizus]
MRFTQETQHRRTDQHGHVANDGDGFHALCRPFPPVARSRQRNRKSQRSADSPQKNGRSGQRWVAAKNDECDTQSTKACAQSHDCHAPKATQELPASEADNGHRRGKCHKNERA